MENKGKNNLFLLTIVAIVAIVAIVIMIASTGSRTYDTSEYAGQAARTTGTIDSTTTSSTNIISTNVKNSKSGENPLTNRKSLDFNVRFSPGSFQSFSDVERDNKKYLMVDSINYKNVKLFQTGKEFFLNGNQEIGYDISPGNPMLPIIYVDLLLPPNTDMSSLLIEESVGKESLTTLKKNIALAPPVYTYGENGEKLFFWGENEGKIVDEKNSIIYNKNVFHPDKRVRIISQGKKGTLVWVKIGIFPLAYNPQKNLISAISDISFSLFFVEGTSKIQPTSKRFFDESVQFFDNTNLMIQDYGNPPGESGNPGYAIITTNQIVAMSTKLDDFITYKENSGYDVTLITEDDFDSLTGPPPNGRAEKIREWLKANYIPLELNAVLLIGNPDPDDPELPGDTVGDIPMKMCWPIRYGGTNPIDIRKAPTDFYYAELTGNWDLNGDTYYCDYSGGDMGPDGVEISSELIVGRIPVYNSDVEKLDHILEKIISYESDNTPPEWREKALLPIKHQSEGIATGQNTNIMLARKGYSTYRIYDTEFNVVPPPDITPVVVDNVIDAWNQGFGVVSWWTHGNSHNAIGIIEQNTNISLLSDEMTPIVFQASCLNGMPEVTDNLAYALLNHGSIGNVAATRYSFYVWNMYPDEFCQNSYFYNQFLLCTFSNFISNQIPIGEALNSLRQFAIGGGGYYWSNLLQYNIYGDPSLSLSLKTGGIVGYVKDISGQSLENSEIFLDGKRTAVKTNYLGQFYLPNVLEGTYNISADYWGYYQPSPVSVTVIPHRNTTITIILTVPGPMDHIDITPYNSEIFTYYDKYFSAEGFDADGHPVDFYPSWNATGGTINEYGLYVAGSEPGVFYISATDLNTGITGTTPVTLIPTPDNYIYNLINGDNFISIIYPQHDGKKVWDIFPNYLALFRWEQDHYISTETLETGVGYTLKNSVTEEKTYHGVEPEEHFLEINYNGLYLVGAPFDIDLKGIDCITHVQEYNLSTHQYTTNYIIKQGKASFVTSNDLCTFEFTNSGHIDSSHTYQLSHGWNFLSPVYPGMEGKNVRGYFPNTTVFFEFDGSYKQTDTLNVGKGYWQYNSIDESVVIEGASLDNFTYNIMEENTFYLIGAPFDIDFVGINCIEDILHYDPETGEYYTNFSLAKGEAAFIKTSAPCIFTVNPNQGTSPMHTTSSSVSCTSCTADTPPSFKIFSNSLK